MDVREVGGDVGHVLVAEVRGVGGHGRVAALTCRIGFERAHDVFGVLAGDHGEVERAVNIIENMGASVQTPAAAREMLGIKVPEQRKVGVAK